jgi:hypothetical protein
MRKRGKHFHGKGSGGNRLAWQNAINMQHGLTHDQRGDLGLAIHTGIVRMRNGIGLEEDFWTFAAMANVSLILCERGVGGDLIGDVFALQDALMEIKARHERTGKWGFSGAEMQAINLGARIHEKQIAVVPRVECREALFEARRRAARGDVLMRVPA